MAPRLQPPTLLSLAHSKVAQNLANICRVLHTLAQETCVAHVLNLTKNTLRPIWQSTVPASIRAQLLEQTTSLLTLQSSDNAGSTTGAAPLYLLVLLLAKDIKKIRIELCCYYGCSHQTTLLKFLANEGKGLESLELARSTLLRLDRSLLQSVLLSATNLRHLTFKNIANDSVLQIIGHHCPNLVSLDVSHSKEVTDAGLQQLFLHVEIRDKLWKSTKKHVQKNPLVRYKKNIHNFTKFLKKLCFPSRERDTLSKDLVTILEYCELRNNLCSTLKYLNIANTGVTNAGILLAILHVPGLESLGEYCHIGRALELLEQTIRQDFSNHYFQLKCVNSSRTTQHRLELISERFPQLKKLKITEPMYLPKSLFIIPRTVVSLSLQSIPSNEQWLQSIFDFLNGPHGQVLEELSLRFFPGDLLPSVDLHDVLPNLRNLRIFNLDGANVEWRTDVTLPQMDNLYKVQMGKVVMMNVICNLLKCCPALRIMHIYSCNQLDFSDLFDAKPSPRLSEIECFYIYETACLSKTLLQSIVDKLPNLRQFGNIRNCGLESEDIQAVDSWIVQNNFDLQLYAGSHWFSSSCFPL
ncbi:uncharacterized protein LOC135846820 [Planococcus citri]|uniref:uncharacterized protein LOC135846820 n=1 Tax=Planococcus citri TaxID=170843 RepID=UPI0031F88505